MPVRLMLTRTWSGWVKVGNGLSSIVVSLTAFRTKERLTGSEGFDVASSF